MKRVILALCVFIALTAFANASEFYTCVDKDGNTFLTNNPPEGAECKSMNDDKESLNQEKQSDEQFQQTGQSEKFKEQKGEIKRLLKITRPAY